MTTPPPSSFDLQAAVAALSTAPRRTIAAKLRALYPVIEAQIQSGVRHDDIVAALQSAGLAELNLITFRSALGRMRREARRAGTTPSKPSRAPATTGLAPESSILPGPVAAPAGGATTAPSDPSQPAAPEDQRGLDTKARRERRADRWLPEQQSGGNPLLSKVKKDHQA